MANDLNQCNFIGRLGADPETRFTAGGDPVCSIRIACGWKGKNSEGTEWVPVVAFGRLAEIMQQYLTKGSQVYISGRFKTDEYEKNGEKRYSTKIVANEMQMLGGGGNAGGNPQQQPPAQQAPQQQPPRQQAAPHAQPAQQQPQQGGFDDDIPFTYKHSMEGG